MFNKRKIALVGAFNLAEGYLGATKALSRLGHEVVFIPAMLYKHESGKHHVKLVIDHIQAEKPDIILWWRAETFNAMEFYKVREAVKGKFFIYSWDDPLQWEKHPEMPQKCEILDAAFSCCLDSVKMYKEYGTPIVEYCPPGFDPEIHYPEEDDKYKCDISLVCTNLYIGNEITRIPHISRKDMFDIIIKEFPHLDIRIYGSESLKEYYPENYKGWIHFNESRKVFYNSKISLDSHIRVDGDGYINERVCQILGSKGFLFVDHVKGLDKILEENKECVIFNLDNIVEKINLFINNNKEIREQGYKKAMKILTWDSWAEKVGKYV